MEKYEVLIDFDFSEGIPLKAGEVVTILTSNSIQTLIDEGKVKKVEATTE